MTAPWETPRLAATPGSTDRCRPGAARLVRAGSLAAVALLALTSCGLLEDDSPSEASAPRSGTASAAESGTATEEDLAEEEPPADPTGETFVLAVTANTAFFAQVAAGAREVAAAEGVELIVVDAGEDPELQAQQLDIAARMGVDGVIVNPVDEGDPAAAVEPIIEADIPLVALDRAIEGAPVDSYVASDNVDGGRQAAQALARLVDYDGLIVHLQGTAAASTSRERGQGFDEGLQDFPGVSVVARQSADFTRDEALRVTTDILQAYPEVVGIFADNDAMALGAVEALRGRAGAGVQVIGFNGTTPGRGAVVSGTMAATVAVQPEELGARGMEQAIAAARGEGTEDVVPVPVQLVDRDAVLAGAAP